MPEQALIVDDEPNMRWVLKEALEAAGYTVSTAGNGTEALALLAHVPIDLVLLDLKMKEMDGLSTLQRIRERYPDAVVIMLTAYGTVATAVEAMQGGAADFLRKPFDVQEIIFKVQRTLERRRLQREVQALRGQVAAQHAFDALIGVDLPWRSVVDQTVTLTEADLDICFYGQAGCGRASLARASHGGSTRRAAPLVELDARALTPAVQVATLLGSGSRAGVWQRAGQGALLLRSVDALGDIGWHQLQRLIAERDAMNRGPRVLMTAPSNLPTEQIAHVAHVAVPSLAEHRNDLDLFLAAWLPQRILSTEARRLLHSYTWPNNVAELRSVCERALRLADDGPIEEYHLPPMLHNTTPTAFALQLPSGGIDLETVEVELIRQALDRASGNKTRAAELLGLTRQTLLYRLEKYGINPNDVETA